MFKGKIKKKEIIVLDCEASGLSNESYPIEIGVSTYTDSFSFLIKPELEWNYWSVEAENIHKIKREELYKNGISVYEAAKILNERLQGEIIFSDSDVFENFWLDKLFAAADMNKAFYVETIYRLNFDKDKYHRKKEELEKKIITHRAENDANIIRKSLFHSLL